MFENKVLAQKRSKSDIPINVRLLKIASIFQLHQAEESRLRVVYFNQRPSAAFG